MDAKPSHRVEVCMPGLQCEAVSVKGMGWDLGC